jgi:uncharacterized surface protein with fasciclin (FAS1) repeats
LGNATDSDYDSTGVTASAVTTMNQEKPVSTRTKTLGVAAAIAAIAVAIPTSIQAYAEPTTTPVEPTPSATTATATATDTATAAPTSTKVPDPQGPGCDAYKSKVPTGAGSIASMALQTGSEAIASNPDLSTFSAAISGKLNPDINIVSVLDGGPYVVFAPTDAAFAKLDAATLETLKTDPVVLLPTLFYHMVLGYLGPNDVQGTMPTQDGRTVVVSGKGGDVKVNDNRVSCAYTARGAYIYMIDEVLIPPTPAAEAGASTTPTSSTTATSTTETSTTATSSAATSSAATSATPTTEATASETPAAETATATTTTAKPAA